MPLPTGQSSFYCHTFARLLANNTAAIALADRLIESLESAGVRTYRPEARHLKAQGLLRRGERQAARDELMAARAVAESIGSRRLLWQIWFALNQLEAERRNSAGAQTLHDPAREI